MKTPFSKTGITLAIAAMFGSSTALATNVFDIDDYYDNPVDVTIKKKLETRKDVTRKLYIYGRASVQAKNAAVATIGDKQNADNHYISNDDTDNKASIGGKALTGAKGNVQTNIAAGENNQQGNSGALAIGARSSSVGIADAQVFNLQEITQNYTMNAYGSNNAQLKGHALAYAIGKVQTNIAAGLINQQKNSMALAVAHNAALAEATVVTLQDSNNNQTDNYYWKNTASLGDSALAGAIGNVQTNITAGKGNQQSNSMAVATKF